MAGFADMLASLGQGYLSGLQQKHQRDLQARQYADARAQQGLENTHRQQGLDLQRQVHEENNRRYWAEQAQRIADQANAAGAAGVTSALNNSAASTALAMDNSRATAERAALGTQQAVAQSDPLFMAKQALALSQTQDAQHKLQQQGQPLGERLPPGLLGSPKVSLPDITRAALGWLPAGLGEVAGALVPQNVAVRRYAPPQNREGLQARITAMAPQMTPEQLQTALAVLEAYPEKQYTIPGVPFPVKAHEYLQYVLSHTVGKQPPNQVMFNPTTGAIGPLQPAPMAPGAAQGSATVRPSGPPTLPAVSGEFPMTPVDAIRLKHEADRIALEAQRIEDARRARAEANVKKETVAADKASNKAAADAKKATAAKAGKEPIQNPDIATVSILQRARQRKKAAQGDSRLYADEAMAVVDRVHKGKSNAKSLAGMLGAGGVSFRPEIQERINRLATAYNKVRGVGPSGRLAASAARDSYGKHAAQLKRGDDLNRAVAADLDRKIQEVMREATEPLPSASPAGLSKPAW